MADTVELPEDERRSRIDVTERRDGYVIAQALGKCGFKEADDTVHGYHTVELTIEEYKKLVANENHIQTDLPDLTAEEREILMTGMCQKAWDKLFPPEEDEDYEELVNDIDGALTERPGPWSSPGSDLI